MRWFPGVGHVRVKDSASLLLVGVLCIPLAVTAEEKAASGGFFTEKAKEVGLDFHHFNGMSGEFYFCEIVGSGAALFDYDRDGDLDVFLVQGRLLGEGKTLEDAIHPPRGPVSDRLFRNDLKRGPNGEPILRFTDVTTQSGFSGEGYGMGVASGDYDNDGDVDLYVTNFGANRLWRNNGDGTFTDATAKAGVEEGRWSVPATFVDVDRDGWLDLFVGNYVQFSVENHKLCRTIAGAPDYCGPLSYKSEPDRLWRNRGDGTFEDISARSRVTTEFGGALGVVAADLNGDGWSDLYVGNDGVPNQMWINVQDGTFRNEALLAGTAVNLMGQPEASMGVATADFDADGDEDLFLTHLIRETNTLYVNDGRGLFEDKTDELGLGAVSWQFTGFGTAWLDVDNDGWLDLLAANGAVKVIEELEAQGDPYPLHQTNQLFLSMAGKRFEEATDRGGAAFQLSEVSRGVAVGDLDNDGDSDVLVLNNAGPARLLVNEVGQAKPWIGFELLEGKPGRAALGAQVGVVRKGRPVLWRRAQTSGSYVSASDPRILVGLGESTSVEHVRVRWTDGKEERFEAEVGRYNLLRRGEGQAAPIAKAESPAP